MDLYPEYPVIPSKLFFSQRQQDAKNAEHFLASMHWFDSVDLSGLKREIFAFFSGLQQFHVGYGDVALRMLPYYSTPLQLFHHGISFISSLKSSCGVHISGQV